MRIAGRLYSIAPSPLMRYSAALIATAAMVPVSFVSGATAQSIGLLAACAAVIVSTSLGGRGPGLLATCGIALLLTYRMQSAHSGAAQPGMQFPLALFVAMGLLITLLNLRLSLLHDDDLTPIEVWRAQVHAPAEATSVTHTASSSLSDNHVPVSRETLYQWNRNCEHIRDLTWYTEECIRVGTLRHARMWAKLAHEIASKTGMEMERVEECFSDREEETAETVEHILSDHNSSKHTLSNYTSANHTSANHTSANHTSAEHTSAEHALKPDDAMEHDRVAKEIAEALKNSTIA